MEEHKLICNKAIDIELEELGLIFLQVCPECGFCFFIEFQESTWTFCPGCGEHVSYSEDHPYFVKL